MSQKYCPKCKTEKLVSHFSPNLKRKDGLQSMCDPCRGSYMKEWYEKNKETLKSRPRSRSVKGRTKGSIPVRTTNRLKIVAYLSEHPCIDCGNDDIEVLEFDHRDAMTKEFQIGDSIRHGIAWKRIELEISKCDVRCANCHRKKTRRQLGWWIDEESDGERIIK